MTRSASAVCLNDFKKIAAADIFRSDDKTAVGIYIEAESRVGKPYEMSALRSGYFIGNAVFLRIKTDKNVIRNIVQIFGGKHGDLCSVFG